MNKKGFILAYTLLVLMRLSLCLTGFFILATEKTKLNQAQYRALQKYYAELKTKTF